MSAEHPGKEPDFYAAFMEQDQGRVATRAGGLLYMATLAQLDTIDYNLAVRFKGSVWTLPLCHDSYDEGNG